MSNFQQIEQAREIILVHDAEIEFKIMARSYKKLGLCAAKEMKLTPEEAKPYAKDLMNKSIDQHDQNKIIELIILDFSKKNISISENQIIEEFGKLKELAHQEIMKN